MSARPIHVQGDKGKGDTPLPANVTAEMAILGAILLNNSHYQEAAGRIEAADFSLDAHRRVFVRMGELIGEGTRVDIVTLAEQLQRNKELSVIGGVAWLAALTEGLPRRPSIEDYVRIVKDKSLLRQTIAESDRVGLLAGDQTGSAEEVLAEAESAFRRIAGKAITSGLISVGEYVRDHYPCIDEIFAHNARLTGIPSGFPGLDNLTAGFQPKELRSSAPVHRLARLRWRGTLRSMLRCREDRGVIQFGDAQQSAYRPHVLRAGPGRSGRAIAMAG